MPDLDPVSLVREAPLAFGPWRELKALYKRLEANPTENPELLGELIGRFDQAALVRVTEEPSVTIGQVHQLVGMAVQGERVALLTRRHGNQVTLTSLNFAVHNRLVPRRVAVPLEQGRQGGQVCWCGPLLAVRSDKAVQLFEPVENELKPLATLNIEAIHIEGAFPYLHVVSDEALHVYDLRDLSAKLIPLAVRGAARVASDGHRGAILAAPSGFRWNRLPSPGGVTLLDRSTPSSPRVVAQLDIKDAHAIALRGERLYVAVGGNWTEQYLHIIDIQRLDAPRTLAEVALGRGYYAGMVEVQDRFAYVLQQYGNLSLVDLEGEIPHVVANGRYPRNGQVFGVAEGWLYWGSYGRLTLWSLQNPEKPVCFGTPPSPETLAYMKRRGRRLLRKLAKTEPAAFVRAASAVLQAGTELEPNRHWVSYDLLFGGGKRFVHQSHGRSRMKELAPRGLGRRQREERGAAHWDAHPEVAAALWNAKTAPWAARELALKALLSSGQPVPILSARALTEALASPSALLVATAIRQVAQSLESGKTVAAKTVATAYYRGVARQRRRLVAPLLALAAADATWGVTFIESLLQQADPERRRRFGAVAQLAAAHFREAVGGLAVIRLVPGLLAAGQENLRQLALAAAATVDEGTLEDWLLMLQRVPSAEDREALLCALEAGVAGKDLGEPWDLIEHDSELVLDALWRLLAASQTRVENLRELWEYILEYAEAGSATLTTAFQSPWALAVLAKTGIDIVPYLEKQPALVSLLTAAAFRTLTQTMALETVLKLVMAASDDAWPRLRSGWLPNLQEGVGTEALWTALAAALKTDTTGRLETRLVADPEIRATITVITSPDVVLELREPALEPALALWWERYHGLVESDERYLLDAATHPLALFRRPALTTLAERSLRLPTALRLLESELPEAMRLARQWFETDNHTDLRARALGLCDSPVPAVRAYGREFVRRFAAALDTDRLAAALFENDAPEMQAFAATLAGEQPAPVFDRAVLRTRHKARRAKEVVKRRQESADPAGQVDTETLLAMARATHATRDADWALQQLAKRALAGEAIPGLSVEG